MRGVYLWFIVGLVFAYLPIILNTGTCGLMIGAMIYGYRHEEVRFEHFNLIIFCVIAFFVALASLELLETSRKFAFWKENFWKKTLRIFKHGIWIVFYTVLLYFSMNVSEVPWPWYALMILGLALFFNFLRLVFDVSFFIPKVRKAMRKLVEQNPDLEELFDG